MAEFGANFLELSKKEPLCFWYCTKTVQFSAKKFLFLFLTFEFHVEEIGTDLLPMQSNAYKLCANSRRCKNNYLEGTKFCPNSAHTVSATSDFY